MNVCCRVTPLLRRAIRILLLKRSGANYMTELSQAAPVNHHRPFG